MNGLTYFLLLLPLWSMSQSFTFSDTTFKKGDVHISRRIFFDFDKATLRPESILYLDTVAAFLNKHPTLTIEVGGHTDTRGSARYSQKLSEWRARAVVDCLVSKGILAARLTYKGYEGTKPIIPDSEIKKMKTKEEIEKAHQTNRRMEFKITGI